MSLAAFAQVSYDANLVFKDYNAANATTLNLSVPANTDDVVLVVLLSTYIDDSPIIEYNGTNIGTPSISKFQATNSGSAFEDVEGSIYVYPLGNTGAAATATISLSNLSPDSHNSWTAMTFSGVDQSNSVSESKTDEHPNPGVANNSSTSLTLSATSGDALITSFNASSNAASNVTVAGDLIDLALPSGGYDEAGYKIASASSHISTYNIVNNQMASFIHAGVVLKQAISSTPEIDVQGNSISIVDGDTSPDTADDTDFGDIINGSSDTHTFTIENTGAGDLTIPANGITINSDVAGVFTLGSISNAFPVILAQNARRTFHVTFAPNASVGTLFEGDISIANNDSDENPYTFDIQGTGTCNRGLTAGLWTGCAGDGLWSTATNWDNNMVPTANDDVLINIDQVVTVSSNAFAKSIELENGADLVINAPFNLEVSTAAISSTGNAIELSIGSMLTNFGTIKISDCGLIGILNQGVVENKPSGTIEIINPGRDGYRNTPRNSTSDELINSGTITIMNAGGNGFDNDGLITNKEEGIITIIDAGAYGIKNGPFDELVNYGTITIINSAIDGILVGDILTNHIGGIITITDARIYGINVGGGEKLINSGTITITNSVDDAIYNNGTVTNNAGGSITITDSGDFGFNNGSRRGNLINSGTITITNSVDDGIINFGTVTNNTVGSITITDSGGFGFYISRSILINSGTITITNSVDDAIFSNRGRITNNNLLQVNGILDRVGSLSGTLAPGSISLPDIVTTTGSLTLTGTLDIDINGNTTAGTHFDQLQVNGTANISGATVDIAFDAGYTPVLNDRIVILTATRVNGTFTVAPALPSIWQMDYSVAGEVAVVYPDPELDLRNNADDADITDGSTTISTSLGTDFGSVCASGTVSSTASFRAENNGQGDLTFDADALSISNPTDFSITTDLTNNGTVAAGGVATFTIEFDPQSAGTKTCTVTINSDDADEDPYTFDIQGVGINPTITLAATTSTATEDGSIDLVYQFTRTCTVGALVVYFSVDGTAQDSDFTLSGETSYASGTGTITFADGSATADLTVEMVDDSMIEGDETVVVKIINPVP